MNEVRGLQLFGSLIWRHNDIAPTFNQLALIEMYLICLERLKFSLMILLWEGNADEVKYRQIPWNCQRVL